MKTWIVYKADSMSATGWERRMLLPSEGLTDILHEEHVYSGHVPKVGDRIYDSKQDDDGEVFAREGDWMVSKVQRFSSDDTDDQIIVCYCAYAPIQPVWERIERGAPVEEMMSVAARS